MTIFRSWRQKSTFGHQLNTPECDAGDCWWWYFYIGDVSCLQHIWYPTSATNTDFSVISESEVLTRILAWAKFLTRTRANDRHIAQASTPEFNSKRLQTILKDFRPQRCSSVQQLSSIGGYHCASGKQEIGTLTVKKMIL